MSVIRSIDLGYGFTKFTESLKGNEPVCSSFASIVGVNSPVPQGDVRPHDTVVTMINGIRYECGRDGAFVVGKNEGRLEGTEYAKSPEYMALVNAALSYMNEDTIDLLMLGLPNSTYASLKDSLKQSMVGIHTFFRPNHKTGKEEKVEVNVKRVVVVRQPMGGLIDVATLDDSKFEGLESEESLIIDIGHYTLDWVFARGMMPVEKLCDGSNGDGATSIHKVIQNKIQSRTGETVDVNKIEARYSSGAEGIKVNGEMLKFSEFDADVKAVVRGALQNMLKKIDSVATIENLVVVGGAAKVYAEVLAEMTKRNDILIPTDPRFSIVRGFQVIGVDINSR